MGAEEEIFFRIPRKFILVFFVGSSWVLWQILPLLFEASWALA